MRIPKAKETVLVISDTQMPFHHPETVDFLQAMEKKYEPTKIVHIGDECDFHAMSRYTHDPDGFSAGDELELLIDNLSDLYELFPKVMLCASNHVDRPYDRAFEAGIPRSFIKDIGDVIDAPSGWQWADKWQIDGIDYVHGHCLPGGKHAIQRAATEYPRSVVFGHVHAHAGIFYKATAESLKFAFNVGCLIDINAYAFKYGKKYIDKPIIGCGIVKNGLPMYVPMLLNKKGKWIG